MAVGVQRSFGLNARLNDFFSDFFLISGRRRPGSDKMGTLREKETDEKRAVQTARRADALDGGESTLGERLKTAGRGDGRRYIY